MSILGKILSSILSPAHASPAPSANPSASAPASSTPASTAAKPSASPAAAPGSTPAANPPTAGAAVDVGAVLGKLAAQNKEKLNWQHSIVDLMKLLNLDSSLAARRQLAEELHYSGDKNDSAAMNIWLHKQVMQKLAENGGKVPDELRHA